LEEEHPTLVSLLQLPSFCRLLPNTHSRTKVCRLRVTHAVAVDKATTEVEVGAVVDGAVARRATKPPPPLDWFSGPRKRQSVNPEPSSPSTGTNDRMGTVMKAGVVGQVASFLRIWQSDIVKWWANKRRERKEKKEREEFWANVQIHNDKTIREINARRRAAKKARVCEEA
jgi:hypothetical protein